jgi:uncharacterized OsmC-like protein
MAMSNKDLYFYTLKMDKESHTKIFNETGEVNCPENSVAYLLVGLLSCMASTAKSILEKMKIDYELIVISGKLYMVDEKIRYSNKIECSLSLEGGPELPAETKERLAQITKKYCTVSVTIQKNPEITLVME